MKTFHCQSHSLRDGCSTTYIIVNLPTEDIIIDFSNEKAVKWYQEKLKELFEMGVSAIKVDFGEAAPYEALYSSGKSGRYEHNPGQGHSLGKKQEG